MRRMGLACSFETSGNEGSVSETQMSAGGQNEPRHSPRRHGRSTSVSGPADPEVAGSGLGQVLPSRPRRHRVRYTPDSRRFAATPKSSESGHFQKSLPTASAHTGRWFMSNNE